MDLSQLQELHGQCKGAGACGVNLEYDERFLEMIRLSEYRPEVQYGSTIVPARGPEWLQLCNCCLEIAGRTRDLRVGVLLVESLCRTHHWSGLAAGLELLSSWTIELWDSIFPRLDAEDKEDPTERLGILSHLVDSSLLIQGISQIPLTEHRTFGCITLRDYHSIISGSPTHTPSKLSDSELGVIFREMNRGELDATINAIQRAILAFAAMDEFVLGKVGMARWSGAPLLETLTRTEQILRSHVAEPVVMAASCSLNALASNITATEPPDDTSVDAKDFLVTQEPDPPSIDVEPNRTTVRISSRSEATVAIDGICAYFEQYEPASPVPLILQRAKRLIPMSFIEIIRELAPNEGHEFLQHLVCPK